MCTSQASGARAPSLPVSGSCVGQRALSLPSPSAAAIPHPVLSVLPQQLPVALNLPSCTLLPK